MGAHVGALGGAGPAPRSPCPAQRDTPYFFLICHVDVFLQTKIETINKCNRNAKVTITKQIRIFKGLLGTRISVAFLNNLKSCFIRF